MRTQHKFVGIDVMMLYSHYSLPFRIDLRFRSRLLCPVKKGQSSLRLRLDYSFVVLKVFILGITCCQLLITLGKIHGRRMPIDHRDDLIF